MFLENNNYFDKDKKILNESNNYLNLISMKSWINKGINLINQVKKAFSKNYYTKQLIVLMKY